MNSRSAKNLSTTHPVLTGESRVDWALWQLSSILAEIAEQANKSKNDSGVSIEKPIHQKMSHGKTCPLIEDVSDD